MNEFLIKRLTVFAVLIGIAILFNTCEKNPTHPTTYAPNPIDTFSANLSGYIYLNCSDAPASNYTLVLEDNGQPVSTYTTDNNGYYSFSYHYSFDPYGDFPYTLYLPKDSISTVLPFDTDEVHRFVSNFNFVLDDSVRMKLIFNFSQSYTNEDTLYYLFSSSQNSKLQTIAGPFPPKIILKYAIPLKDLGLNYGNTIYYGYRFGLGYLYYENQSKNFIYTPCSPIDSLVTNY